MSGRARITGSYTNYESESEGEEDYRPLRQHLQKAKDKEAAVAEGNKSNENSFLDTNKYPLNQHFPKKVDKLREKMLEHRSVVKNLGGGDWFENKYNLQKALKLGKDVQKAHQQAIGTHKFVVDGKEVNFEIGKEGSMGNKVRFVENPITNQKLHLSTDAGAYHKNPVGIKNRPQNHSAYHSGGRKTRRRRYKKKATRKAKRHHKSRRGRKAKKSKSKRRTRRR